MPGDPLAVRVGPGTLYTAPLGSTEPTDLATAWDAAWIELGYTDQGSTFTFNQTFEDVTVEEELDPLKTMQTARQVLIAFALAELTATNMQRALNGGTITSGTGIVTFEPPTVGEATELMLGWEADDALERWVFRQCTQVGSLELPRRKAPNKAILGGAQWRAVKPAGAATFAFIHDDDYTA